MTTSGIRLCTLEEMEVRGTPEPLVKGVLPTRSLAMLYGAPKTFKTFTVLDMELCIATGRAWHGHPTTQGAVVHILAEGSDEFPPRVRAWYAHYHVDPTGVPFYMIDRPVQLLRETEVEDLLAALTKVDTLRLVVVDTLGRSMLGGKEKDNDDFHSVTAAMDSIRRTTGATVMAVHHTGHNGDLPRGASAMQGDMNTVIQVKRPGKATAIEVVCRDQKDGPHFEDILLCAVSVSLPGGALSLVTVDEGEAQTADDTPHIPTPYKTGRREAQARLGSEDVLAVLRVHPWIGPTDVTCRLNATRARPVKVGTVKGHLARLVKARRACTKEGKYSPAPAETWVA